MAGDLLLGLHITKCAGTSLMTTLRRVLSEDEYYFFSSYHESWLASRPGFADIVSTDRLRIVFGHYCHETLLSVFAHRSIFLFTGLREPVACAVSGYRQVNAVRALAGRDPVSAEDYLADHPNPACTELLRCMPSAAAAYRGATWQRARACLGLFDFVYATERFDADAMVILDVLGLPRATIASDNISNARGVDASAAAYVAAEAATIEARDREFLGEDMRLWEAMRPHLGRPWMRRALAGEPWVLDRDALFADLPEPGEARRVFCARERDFMLHEFEVLGRLDRLRESLQARIANAGLMLERLHGA